MLDARSWPAAVGRFTPTGRRIQAITAAFVAKNAAHTWALMKKKGFPPDEAAPMVGKVAE